MTETWVLFGEHFRLPLLVTWDASPDVAKVELHPGVPWMPAWKQAATEVLSKVAFSEAEAFYIFREKLNLVAALSDKAPEDILVWNPQRLTHLLPMEDLQAMTEKQLAEVKEIRGFLASFINATGVTMFATLEELEAFYYLLNQFMAIWMLEQQRPVPLVFGKLFASPLRANWERVTRDRIKGGLHKRTYAERLLLLLYRGEMRAVDVAHKTEWLRLEVTWNDAWKLMVTNSEVAMLKEMGERHYIDMIDERLKKTLPLLVSAFHHFRKEQLHSTLSVHYPKHFVSLAAGRIKHRIKSPNFTKKQRQRLRDRMGLALEIRRQKLNERRQAKAAALRAVSALQPQQPDVRDAGGTIYDHGGGI